MRELIRKILREEREKDLSPLIKELLNTSLLKKYEGWVCAFSVIKPTNRPYTIAIFTIGGVDSKHWPVTQFVRNKRENIVDDVWQKVYNYLGVESDVNLIYVKFCDEIMNEGLHDTSWQNDEGDKITLVDLLDATENIPVKNISVEKLKPKLLSWDGNKKEIAKIEKANLKYPILIFVDDKNRFVSIIDGHHRAQKAVKHKLKSIKAKLIPINSLPKNFKKVFGHLGKQEQNESKGTNRKDLDFFDLVDKEIIFITEPFGDGKKQKSNWEGDSNIITLWNLENPEKGQEWVFDAIKYPKPEAIQWWNDEGQYTLKDEKYNQILRSIKMYDNSNKQEQNESIDDIQGIPLYHHTTESRALSIMNTDMMRGTKPDDDILDVDPTLANTKHQSMVSFTRDKNFIPNETIGASAGGLRDSNKLKVIFVVDKDKLKSHYKIVPFDYSALEDRWYDKRIKDEPDTIMQPRAIRKSKSNEYEERVLTNKIEPLRRYIIDIIYKGDNPLVQEKIDEYLNNNSSKQEQNESELTERCWKGYTQKGMKTMFGKRYPNCIKKK